MALRKSSDLSRMIVEAEMREIGKAVVDLLQIRIWQLNLCANPRTSE